MSGGSPKRNSLRNKKSVGVVHSDTSSSEDSFLNIEDEDEDGGEAGLREALGILNAFAQEDSWSFAPVDQPETAVIESPPAPEEVKETGELAVSKRELLTDFDFPMDSGAPPAAPTSTVKLVPHPGFQTSPGAGTTIYRRKEDGGLGAAKEDKLLPRDFSSYLIGRPVPVHDTKGMPMVACNWVYGGEYLIGRNVLVEETYQRTLTEIDANDKAGDEILSGFWTRVSERLLDMTEVTLPIPLSAIPMSAGGERRGRQAKPVEVPPGTYRKIGIANQRVDFAQLSPFSLIISVEGEEMLVAPDILSYDLIKSAEADTSEEEAGASEGVPEEKADVSEKADAPEENPLQGTEVPPQVAEALREIVPESEEVRAVRLTAEQIMASFTGNAGFARYVKLPERPDWLRDEHIHYVTEDQMGALLVLDKMPKDQDEIEAARADDRFAEGKTTNGLRIGDDIHIRENRTGIGTEHHETVHTLSHPAVLEVLGFWFNEGLTEHFTQLLLEGGEIVRNKDQYGQQHRAITALMEYAGVTESELADAYFRGELQPLYDRVAARAVSPPFSWDTPFSLDAYAARLDGKHAPAARLTLQKACGFDEVDSATDDTTTAAGDTATGIVPSGDDKESRSSEDSGAEV